MDTEKVYCYDYPRQNNDMAWWAMSNQWNNNPFIYFMLPAMMRMMYGDNWNDHNRGDYAEINARFNQLQGQLSDNHNTDIINEAVKGNTTRIGELATNLGVDHRAIMAGLGDLRAGLQNVGGDVKAGFQGLQGDVRFTGERIINSNLLGAKDLQAAIKDCCCNTQQNIQKFGYENQLAIGQQTYTINERLTGIANGLQKGFSDIGYLLAQNKGEIIVNQDRNTQRLLDQMCATQTQALRDALAAKDRELLAANIIAGVKKEGCGCGVA